LAETLIQSGAKITVFARVDTHDLKCVGLCARYLTKDNIPLVQLLAHGVDRLIRFRPDCIISDDLEHKVGTSLEIETQLDILSNLLFARNKSGIGYNSPHTYESYAKNDEKAPKNTFIHVLTLLSNSCPGAATGTNPAQLFFF